MDPVTALTLVSTVLGISKDIYLLGKWVHNTAQSMHNHDNERDQLTEDFRAEFNKLNSFTRLFAISRQGIKGDEDLVSPYIFHVSILFANQRLSTCAGLVRNHVQGLRRPE